MATVTKRVTNGNMAWHGKTGVERKLNLEQRLKALGFEQVGFCPTHYRNKDLELSILKTQDVEHEHQYYVKLFADNDKILKKVDTFTIMVEWMETQEGNYEI